MNRYPLILEEPTPCQLIMQAAAQYYEQPVANLKLKAPLTELYAASESDKPFGQWVSNVPRPGDVAGCVNKKLPKGRLFLGVMS